MGRGAVSSPLEFSRGAGELSLHSRAGGAPARRPGSLPRGAPRCRRPAPRSGARRGRSIPASLQSSPAPARLPASPVCSPVLQPRKEGVPLPSDSLADVPQRAARSFRSPRSSRRKEGGEGASQPWSSDWKPSEETLPSVMWPGWETGIWGAKRGVGGYRGSRNRLRGSAARPFSRTDRAARRGSPGVARVIADATYLELEEFQ